MVQLVGGELERNDTNKNAMGGTELIAHGLHERLDKDLLKDLQIVFSRVRGDLHEDKVRVFFSHDLPGDPESEFLHDRSKQQQFHSFVFVSNWQMQQYIQRYNLPWHKCIVQHNAITPIDQHVKPDHKEQLNLVYFSTPHRGLELLVPVFKALAEKHEHVHLHVYSSFKLYGWEQRDKPYQELIEECINHPRMIYHSSVPNEDIRRALQEMHVLAYPCIWPETSCLVLMEAMSAGLTCVHSNFAALFETASNWTTMYQYSEDPNDHARKFYSILSAVVENYDDDYLANQRNAAKQYVNYFHNWERRAAEWSSYLEQLRKLTPDRSLPKTAAANDFFHIKTN